MRRVEFTAIVEVPDDIEYDTAAEAVRHVIGDHQAPSVKEARWLPVCPFKIGQRVTLPDGRPGVVDRIMDDTADAHIAGAGWFRADRLVSA